jgi:hypothetical protein
MQCHNWYVHHTKESFTPAFPSKAKLLQQVVCVFQKILHLWYKIQLKIDSFFYNLQAFGLDLRRSGRRIFLYEIILDFVIRVAHMHRYTCKNMYCHTDDIVTSLLIKNYK